MEFTQAKTDASRHMILSSLATTPGEAPIEDAATAQLESRKALVRMLLGVVRQEKKVVRPRVRAPAQPARPPAATSPPQQRSALQEAMEQANTPTGQLQNGPAVQLASRKIFLSMIVGVFKGNKQHVKPQMRSYQSPAVLQEYYAEQSESKEKTEHNEDLKVARAGFTRGAARVQPTIETEPPMCLPLLAVAEAGDDVSDDQ